MNSKYLFRNLIIAFFLLLFTFGCTSTNSRKVTIATAANMQFVMKEIAAAFTQETGIDCDVIISSSGKLTAQIKEGAPYDVFISADTKYPKILYEKGFTSNIPKIYGYGTLVLWSFSENVPLDINLLTQNQIEHIALANPKTAPYGTAAIEVLKHAKIYDQISEKLVFGESISQTNQFILSGAAQIGFTAKSVVLSPQMKGKGEWISIDSTSYTPIAQAAVIIKKDKISDAAMKFYEFLFSTKSKEILENFGYLVPVK
ncbi:molybdate ABC transporter substrate-binding protein [Aquimarina celericrescens]|uniref:Molybdate ABC transporter substrate-binding protein n=1 Tax=Aquimarina celericrescens TaxID=1964542 RepID=A0ABW5AW12_9FLAO|nr:molybdate ABC transporter substrate-binding protein [Aquimarina celericrescens]